MHYVFFSQIKELMHNTSREHKITLTQMEQKFFEEKVIFVVYFFFSCWMQSI